MAILLPRAVCVDDFGYRYNCTGTWDSWARWVFLGLVILAILFLFFLFSCITARRRRRMGQQPFRGTGWAAHGPPPQNNPNTYYAYQQPAPPYEPNPQYRNDQSTGIELNRPAGTYHGEYAPPPGPPPAKKWT